MTYTSKVGALGVAALLFLNACNNTTTTESKSDTSVTTAPMEPPPAPAPAPAAAPAMNVDSNFVATVAAANSTELRILEAAGSRGTNKELKVHAKMMIADHKKLGEGVKAYAQKKNYPLPADDGSEAKNKLDGLDKNAKGAAWDKAWTDEMVNAHQDAINLFEKNANDVKDDELKKMINDALPTLHKHLDMMKDLQGKMNK
jgi:putative membrane protein